MKEVAILGAGAYLRSFADLPAIVAGEPDADFDVPRATLVPARQRRRASTLSRAIADAYAGAIETAGVDAETIASVIGSALGEAETMIGLLDQMWSETAMLSPMKFATSVHNAASGMLSIATQNRGYTTSIGADFDTPAMALLEGIAWVATHDEPVLVCCGDEEPPADLVPNGSAWGLLAAAIVLAPVDAGQPSAFRLSVPAIQPATLEPKPLEDAIGLNPCVGLLDLVLALQSGESGTLRLDRGAGRGYAVTLASSEPAP